VVALYSVACRPVACKEGGGFGLGGVVEVVWWMRIDAKSQSAALVVAQVPACLLLVFSAQCSALSCSVLRDQEPVVVVVVVVVVLRMMYTVHRKNLKYRTKAM
jgi:hypothetical protein